MIRTFICAGLSALLLAGSAYPWQQPKAHRPPSYADIKPILSICAECHKGSKPAHSLNLTTYAAIMKGDKQGRVVVKGNLAKSRLIGVLHGKPQLMPPGGELDPAKIKKLEAWVASGARQK